MRLLFALIALSSGLRAAQYTVSPSGDDAAAGTLSAPWKTLTKAASIAVAGDTVNLRQGVYRETLTSVRAGTASLPIVFQGYGGEKAVLAGTDIVNGTWVLQSGNIWRMDAQPTAIGLFVDGELMQPARWPNAAVGDYYGGRATADTGSNGSTLVDAALPAFNLTTARVHITPGSGWVSYTRGVTAYGGGQFTFDSNIGGTNAAYYPKSGNPYMLYNDLALLDAPGEWYQDGSGRIYLYVPGGGSPAAHIVEIGVRKKVANITHDYLQVKNLYTFGGGVNYTGSHGLVQGVHQRFVQHYTEVDGYGAEGTYNGFNGGSAGVWQDGDIDGSAGDGLILSGSGHSVSGMSIHNVCYIGTYRGGIRTGGSGHTMTGNTIYDSGRFLIFHGGTKGGSIDHNELYRAGLMTHDLGATYAFQTDGGGMVIAYNHVHDVSTTVGCGIYLDNGSSNFKVHHNLVHDITHVGIKLNLPSYGNQVINNTVWNCKYAVEGTGSSFPQEMSGTSIVNNLINNSIKVITTGTYAAFLSNNGIYSPVAFSPGYHLATGSGAIDQGTLWPPFTNGFSGSAPDVGAFEYSQTPWTCGSTSPVPPFPYPSAFGNPTATPTLTRSPTLTPTRTRTRTPQPTPTVTWTPTPSRTPSRSATRTATTTPVPAPSAIDYSVWQLQEPDGSTVSSSQLVAGYSDAYFYVAADGNQVLMDPQTGTTTSGSLHPRTELREMKGASQAAWAPAGTNTLAVAGQVTQLGGGSGGKTTVGQVFNSTLSIPLCELIYSEALGGFEILYEEAKGAGTYIDLATPLPLNSPYTFSLSLSDGVLTVTINGAVVYTHTPSASVLTDTFYFKCGDYDQTAVAGTVTTTPYTVVENSSIVVDHHPSSPTCTASRSPTASASPSPSRTPTSTASATLSPTGSITFSPTGTTTGSPTPSPTGSATASPTPSVSATVTATGSESYTGTSTSSPTVSFSVTPTESGTKTPTGTSSASSTRTPPSTRTYTASPSSTLTQTSVNSATATSSPSATLTPTSTASKTAASTGTRTVTTTTTVIGTRTPSATPSRTPYATVLASPTASPTPSLTGVAEPTAVPTAEPARGEDGPLVVTRALAAPNPCTGPLLHLAYWAEGRSESCLIRLYSPGMRCLAETRVGGSLGSGWQGADVPLPPDASGLLYFKLNLVGSGGRKSEAVTGRVFVVR